MLYWIFLFVVVLIAAIAGIRLAMDRKATKPSTTRTARVAMVAAVYVVLCLVLAPFSFGAVHLIAQP